jgi:hypothetical protein
VREELELPKPMMITMEIGRNLLTALLAGGFVLLVYGWWAFATRSRR